MNDTNNHSSYNLWTNYYRTQYPNALSIVSSKENKVLQCNNYGNYREL